jgi:hypothetical protein
MIFFKKYSRNTSLFLGLICILSFSLSIKASETEKPTLSLEIAQHKARLAEILSEFQSNPNNRDKLIIRYNEVCIDMFTNIMEVLVVYYDAVKKFNSLITTDLDQRVSDLSKIVNNINANNANYTGTDYLDYADYAFETLKTLEFYALQYTLIPAAAALKVQHHD